MIFELRYLTYAHCLIMFYFRTKFCESISMGFRVTDPNSTLSRVYARVVANVDGQMDA